MTRMLPLLLLLWVALPHPARASASLPGNLSLVYPDAFRGDGVDVRVAAAEGSNPHTVASYPRGTRLLALRGPLLALASGDDLVLLDLRDGTERRAPLPGVSGALIGDGATVFATARGGCVERPYSGETGFAATRLLRLDARTGEAAALPSVNARDLSLLSYDAGAGELWVAPHGCDPRLSAVWTLDARTGERRRTIEVEGCGPATLSPDARYAAAAWTACSPSARREQTVISLHDLTGVGAPPTCWWRSLRCGPVGCASRRLAAGWPIH